MAKAKYTRQKNGYFQTKVWDGTYTKDGKKHLVNLRTNKSSRELEAMVTKFNAKVSAREFVRDSDSLFIDYAREWLKLYKADASLNTRKMYENIIEKHFRDINCHIGDVSRAVYVFTINNIEGARTRQQAAMTFKQVIKSAVRDRLIAPAALDEIFEDSVKIKYKSPEKRPLAAHEKAAIPLAGFLTYGEGIRLHTVWVRSEARRSRFFDQVRYFPRQKRNLRK